MTTEQTSTESRMGPGPRVLFLALDTYSRVGGMQNFNRRVISNLCALRDRGEITDVAACIMRDMDEDLPQGVSDHVRGFGSSRLGFIRAALAAARRCNVLLVGQVNLVPVGWLCKLVNSRIRLVLFVHGVEVWNAPEFRRTRFYEPALLRWYDRIAAVSRFTAEVMAREFVVPRSRFTIFPNAIDGPVEQPTAPSKPWLLSVTRLAPHDRSKYVDQVVRAFATLVGDHPDARLVVVGDGARRQELEELAAELGVADRVDFTGRVSNDRLVELYRQARAFVLPSTKEGFGIVYLEAWKYGLPVICADRGAPKEIVEDGVDGFVVSHTDIDALARHMDIFLGNPDGAAAMGAAGARKVTGHYLNERFRYNLMALIAARGEPC
jgi:glycosyltransferase involved in cell wall biosynthesis